MSLKIIVFAVFVLCAAIANYAIKNAYGQNLTDIDLQKTDAITIQNTSSSIPAASAKINNQEIPHSIVVALPLREDGKLWTGTVTFTSSKPIETEVLHIYHPILKPDEKHGEPSNAKWFDGTPIALSTMTMFTNTPITITDKPYSSGSFTFAGSSLLFHKTNGQPFSVTYTLDAVAKNATK